MDLLLKLFILVLVLAQVVVFGLFLVVLNWNFLFELVYLRSHTFELHFEFSDFFKSFSKILAIQVAIWSDCLIEILLLFKSGFLLNIFLLQFCDQIVFEFYLLQTLVVLCICLWCFNSVFLLFLPKVSNNCTEPRTFKFTARYFMDELRLFVI